MLVLSRSKDQSIVIGAGTDREVVVTVMDIRGTKVRLGVQATSDVSIHRKEVQDRINQQ